MVARRKPPGPATEGEREAAWRAAGERLGSAWRGPLPSFTAKSSDDEGVFLQAVMAWHDDDDISPILEFIQSDRPLPGTIRRNLADLIATLHARSRPRSNGKPPGTHARWTNPNYVVAFLIEHRIEAWRKKNGKRRLPDHVKDEIIKDTINKTKEWAIMRDRRALKPGRMRSLLREPKSRRL